MASSGSWPSDWVPPLLDGASCPPPLPQMSARPPKRTRYSDVYNAAFCSASVPVFVDHTLKRFRASPAEHVALPRHVDCLLRTQSLARDRDRPAYPVCEVRWALSLARFVERRAARVITRGLLAFWYAPTGPWLARTLEAVRARGWAKL